MDFCSNLTDVYTSFILLDMKTIVETDVRTTSVRRWGNSHGVLLPKVFIDALNLQSAEMRAVVRGSSIVLTKAADRKKGSKKMTLKEMVRGMRADDRHELVDFGPPRGREIW